MNCDPIARWYGTLEHLVFGSALERCRGALLGELGPVRKALVIGDGDGRFLREFLQRFPDAEADYVDLSAKMLECARQTAGTARVRYFQRNALIDPWPGEHYDLIATHFVFDCFPPEEQRELVARTPQTRWLISEFRERSGFSRMLIAIMYAFFGAATGLKTRKLADHRKALHSAGYAMALCVEHRGGLLVSELWVPGPVK